MRRGYRPILIAGPTASGKSAFALSLARTTGGRLINADSMQVYDGLPILSASPTPAERAEVPHRLYNHVDPMRVYSTGAWLRDARAEIAECQADDVPAIIVGGTGLYFKALTEGLVQLPQIQPDLRQAVRDEITRRGPAAMHTDLAEIDPDAAARIAPQDGQRIARALEVYRQTGKPLSVWQSRGQGSALVPVEDAVAILLDPPREERRARIELRFDQMLAADVLAEAARFAARDLPDDRPVLKTLGYGVLVAHLKGELTLTEARLSVIIATQQFAKRQMTWFRNQFGQKWRRMWPPEPDFEPKGFKF